MHISYSPGSLRILDQTALPQRTEFLELTEWQPIVDAIRGMKVRGAPAIGIAAAYALAIAAHRMLERSANSEAFFNGLATAAQALAASRPTAVNLSWALSRCNQLVSEMRSQGATPEAITTSLDDLAREIHEEDIAACRRIGDAGAALLGSKTRSVITHCNTGDLATGGYGTALGIVRSAWREGRLRHVYVDETRPLLQGARLTAWELQRDGIPYTLITDNMAAQVMRNGDAQAVIVGADRVARNGDVANKIGTYALAVLARAHDIPLIVAAPLSTLDIDTPDGAAIPIEQRAAEEVLSFAGVQAAPQGATTLNPAFDVTPAGYVSAIVTEAGVLQPPYGDKIVQLVQRAAQAQEKAAS